MASQRGKLAHGGESCSVDAAFDLIATHVKVNEAVAVAQGGGDGPGEVVLVHQERLEIDQISDVIVEISAIVERKEEKGRVMRR